MCVAVYVPKDKTPDKNVLVNCWLANPDGGGYMFSDRGNLIVRKPFFTWESFAASLDRDIKMVDSAFVLHFRITTSGKEDKLNTHPHRVNNKLAFVHNGIITDLSAADSPESDTVKFKNHLTQLRTNFLNNKAVSMLIESYAKHNSSKFVFMDNLGRVNIFNEAAGTWEDGVWYSNLNHKWFGYGYGHTSYEGAWNKDKCPVCGQFSLNGARCYKCTYKEKYRNTQTGSGAVLALRRCSVCGLHTADYGDGRAVICQECQRATTRTCLWCGKPIMSNLWYDYCDSECESYAKAHKSGGIPF